MQEDSPQLVQRQRLVQRPGTQFIRIDRVQFSLQFGLSGKQPQPDQRFTQSMFALGASAGLATHHAGVPPVFVAGLFLLGIEVVDPFRKHSHAEVDDTLRLVVDERPADRVRPKVQAQCDSRHE